jgi:hypothetical protein
VYEGWYGDDYLILFDATEVASASDRYGVSQLLPGYQVLGLCGWDDFIVRDSEGRTYSVPTVPISLQYLSPYQIPASSSRLTLDDRFAGKIKWYVQPVVFGGDPKLGKNVIWVSHEQHAEIVRWWNEKYRALTWKPTAPTGSP